MKRRHVLALALVVIAVGDGGQARADRCASYGPRGSLDSGADGAVVASNFRFRVWLYATCGAPEGGPEHRYRILDPAGQVVAHDVVTWHGALELTPRDPLLAGPHRLEVRRPVSATALGPWEQLGAVRVSGAPDRRAPDLAGLAAGESRAKAGTLYLSPCHAEEGWERWTRVSFDAARDDADHDQLIYVLDRRPPGAGVWEPRRTFRPSRVAGRWSHAWEAEDGWGETWEYRLRVRDFQGHETVGRQTLTLTHAVRPTFGVGAARPRIHAPPSAPARTPAP